jgi:phage shock protein A
MQARAGAIDELLASGALEDHVGGNQDYIQAELDKLGAGAGIEADLARMKNEIAASAPKQIEGNGARPAEAVQDVEPADQQAGDGL